MSSGYKGYGLAMMVEVFCGILAGAEFGPRIRLWKDTERIANLVSLFQVDRIHTSLLHSETCSVLFVEGSLISYQSIVQCLFVVVIVDNFCSEHWLANHPIFQFLNI